LAFKCECDENLEIKFQNLAIPYSSVRTQNISFSFSNIFAWIYNMILVSCISGEKTRYEPLICPFLIRISSAQNQNVRFCAINNKSSWEK
jgi:hypothetical protein